MVSATSGAGSAKGSVSQYEMMLGVFAKVSSKDG